MRLFAFIMAVVILVLSCMPCRDNDAVAVNAEKAHIELTQKNGQEHPPHKDLCSPLCICACCSSTSVPEPLQMVAISLPAIKPAWMAHYLGSIVSISLPVWQPPQLIA